MVHFACLARRLAVAVAVLTMCTQTVHAETPFDGKGYLILNEYEARQKIGQLTQDITAEGQNALPKMTGKKLSDVSKYLKHQHFGTKSPPDWIAIKCCEGTTPLYQAYPLYVEVLGDDGAIRVLGWQKLWGADDPRLAGQQAAKAAARGGLQGLIIMPDDDFYSSRTVEDAQAYLTELHSTWGRIKKDEPLPLAYSPVTKPDQHPEAIHQVFASDPDVQVFMPRAFWRAGKDDQNFEDFKTTFSSYWKKRPSTQEWWHTKPIVPIGQAEVAVRRPHDGSHDKERSRIREFVRSLNSKDYDIVGVAIFPFDFMTYGDSKAFDKLKVRFERAVEQEGSGK